MRQVLCSARKVNIYAWYKVFIITGKGYALFVKPGTLHNRRIKEIKYTEYVKNGTL